MFYFLAIFALSLFDIVATHYQIIVYGSFEIEANPFMRWIMIEWGMVIAYVVRLTIPAIGVPLIYIVGKKSKFSIFVLRFTLITHFLLASWHLYLTNFFTIHG